MVTETVCIRRSNLVKKVLLENSSGTCKLEKRVGMGQPHKKNTNYLAEMQRMLGNPGEPRENKRCSEVHIPFFQKIFRFQ